MEKVVDDVTSIAALFLYGASRIERLEVARQLHAHSVRANASFVEAHLTTIPRALREEYLFGKTKGMSWVAQAQGGTLLIDELDCLTPVLQRRFADLLMTGEHDIRIMFASRYDQDVLLHYGELDDKLHAWLKTLKSSQCMGPDRIQAIRSLPDDQVAVGLSAVFEPVMRDYIEAGLKAGTCTLHAHVVGAVEKPLIDMVLQYTGGNQLRAAALLGVNRNTLRKRIRDLNIVLPKGE